MLPGLISLYTQGTSKEVAIVVGDSDSFSSGSEIDEDEPLQVKGSPLKLIITGKYRISQRYIASLL